MPEAACPSSEPDLHLGPAVTAVDVRTDQVSQDVFHDSDRKSVLFFFYTDVSKSNSMFLLHESVSAVSKGKFFK